MSWSKINVIFVVRGNVNTKHAVLDFISPTSLGREPLYFSLNSLVVQLKFKSLMLAYRVISESAPSNLISIIEAYAPLQAPCSS